MKESNPKDKNRNESKHLIQLVIGLFICLVLGLSIFLGNNFFLTVNILQEGQISQRDIYASCNFSFTDENSQRIEVKRNELIIQRGEKVSKIQEMAIKELHAVQRQPESMYFFLGIFLLVVLLSAATIAFLSISNKKIFYDLKNVILLCLLMLLILLGTKTVVLASWPVYLIPVASVSMLIAILIDLRIALFFTVIISVFIGVITGMRFDLMAIMLIGGFVGVYSVINLRHRRNLTKAGFLVGVVNMISIFTFGLLNFMELNNLIIRSGWMGIANGIISAGIVTVALPVLETLFGITTNISLLELSDLNQPLLKELILKAPGTYHHSLVVGNLAESAAESVGANSLLARVGAYFHDIGKIRMAQYFSENQPKDDNKHENLTPTISSLIIISHIKEGADLAKKYKLGRAINDIIIQHHGIDVVHYFYHRALAQHEEERGKVQAEDFRYPGPKPQSKEAAIVMLADSVEAASRAMAQPSPGKIQELVKRIINNKFIDGQLDECDLTLKDLHVISEVFLHILNGIYHTRVEYPDLKQSNNEQSKNKESSEKN